jgi:type IV pilus assembly protein PilA
MREENSQAGFTLIEVMLVMLIIGVLAAIVMPSVRANANRAKMSEAILMLGPCKNMVTEIYLSGGDPPARNTWGCEKNPYLDETAVSQYVRAIKTTDEGIVLAVLQGFGTGLIDTQEITLAPLDGSDRYPSVGTPVRRWRCGSVADGTSIYLRPFLPSSCSGA